MPGTDNIPQGNTVTDESSVPSLKVEKEQLSSLVDEQTPEEAQQLFKDSGATMSESKTLREIESKIPDVSFTSNKEWESYQGYDINFSPYLDRDLQRAQNQNNWAQFGGFLNQAIVGEVVGGTIEGFGLLADMVYASDSSKPEYWLGDRGNLLTEFGGAMREWTQETTPIYAENAGEMDFSDPAFWFQGGVSVATFASLAIPTSFAVRSLGMLGKASRIGKGLKALSALKFTKFGQATNAVKASKWAATLAKNEGRGTKLANAALNMIKGAPNAVASGYISRQLESTMEGGGVFDELMQEYESMGFTTMEARKAAAIGAARTVEIDKALLMMDIAQYAIAGVKFNPVQSGLTKLAEGSEKSLVKGLTKAASNSAKMVTQFVSEGAEEGFQFAAAEEGKLMARMAMGKELHEQDRGMWERTKAKYIHDAEMQTSMFFGGLGGTMFQAFQPLMDKSVHNKLKQGAKMLSAGIPMKDMKEAFARNSAYGQKIREADGADKERLSRNMRLQAELGKHAQNLTMNRLDATIADLEAQQQMTPEQIEAENAKGGPQIGDDFKIREESLAIAKRMQEVYNEAVGEFGPDRAAQIAQGEEQKILLRNKALAYEATATDYENALPLLDTLSSEGRGIWNAKLDIKTHEALIKALEFKVGSGSIQHSTSLAIQDRIVILKKEKAELEAALATQEAVERDSKTKRNDTAGLSETNISDVISNRVESLFAKEQLNLEALEVAELRNPKTAEESLEAVILNAIKHYNSEDLNSLEQSMEHDPEYTDVIKEAVKARHEEISVELSGPADSQREAQNVTSLEAAKVLVETDGNNITEGEVNVTADIEDTDAAIASVANIATPANVKAAVKAHENAIQAMPGDKQPDIDNQPVNQPDAEKTNTEVQDPSTELQEDPIIADLKKEVKKHKSMLTRIDNGTSDRTAEEADAIANELELAEQALDRATNKEANVETPVVVETPIYGETTIFKKNIYTLGYKSIRNGGRNTAAVKAFSDWVERPATDKVGTKIELSIDPDYIGDGRGIRATVIGKDGNPLTIDGQEVYASLHAPEFQDGSTGKANPHFVSQREAFVKMRNEVLAQLDAGNKAFTSVTEISGGHFLKHNNKGKALADKTLTKLSELDVADSFTPQLFLSNGTDLNNGTKANEHELIRTSGMSGQVYMSVPNPSGKPWAASLDMRKLDATEARGLAVTMRELFEGKKKNDLSTNGFTSGLTIGAVMDLTVYASPKTSGQSYHLNFDKQSNTITYGSPTKVLTTDNIKDEKNFEDFVTFLENNMTFNVKRELINKPLPMDFKFNGNEYKKGEPYNGFVVGQDAAVCAFQARDGVFFTQPSVTFNPTIKFEEGPKEAALVAESVAEAVVTNNDTVAPLDDSPTPRVRKTRRRKFAVTPSRVSNMGNPIGNAEQGREWIRRVLGNKVSVVVKNGLLKINEQGDLANGAFVNSMIVLSNKMAVGTEYHEAFHAVTHLYLTEQERTEVYDEAKSKYGEPTKADLKEAGVETREEWLEERLANDFQLFMSTGFNKFAPKTKGFFGKILELIKNVFRKPQVVDRLFNRIPKGHFRNAAVTPRVARMSNKALHSRVSGFTIGQTKALADSMVAEIIADADVFGSEDINAITEGHITPEFIRETIEDWQAYMADDVAAGVVHPAEGQKYINTYDQALNEIDTIHKVVMENFKAYGLERTKENDSELANLAPAFESSRKDNASGNVKLLLSTLPKMDHRGMELRNPLSGQTSLVPMSATWGAIEKTLAGMVTTYNQKEGTIVSAWEQMLEGLKKLKIARPEIQLVIDKLNDDAYSQEKKTQFFNAFSSADMGFQTPKVSGKPGERLFVPQRSNKYTAADQVIYEWKDSFSDMMQRYNEGGVPVTDEQKVANLMNFYDASLEVARKVVKTPADLVEAKRAVEQMFTQLGMPLSLGTMDYFSDYTVDGNLRPGANEMDRYINALRSLSEPFKKGLNEVLSGEKSLHTWAGDWKALRELAGSEALKRDDISEAAVQGAGTSTYYQYSKNNYIFKQSAELQQNPELLNRMMAVPYNSNSQFLQAIKDGTKFKVEAFNNFNDDKYQEMSPADELALRINQTLAGKASMLTAADKGVWFTLDGFTTEFSNIFGAPQVENRGNVHYDQATGQYNIGNKAAVDTFGNYFIDELARMKVATRELDTENGLAPEQLIQYYHTGPKNALKSALFPSLSPGEEMSAGTKAMAIYMESKNNEATWNSEIHKVINPTVRESLNARITEDFEQALELGIVFRDEKGELVNNSLDVKELQQYIDTGVTNEQAMRQMLADYSLNQLRTNVESTKLFTGDPAYYKSMADFQKRIPGGIAPGMDLNITDVKDIAYNIAVINDFETSIKSEYFDQYKEALIADGMGAAAAEELLSPYKDDNINVADAQGYITLDRYEFLLKKLGQWREDKMAGPFARLKAGGKLEAGDAVMLQPLKGMYFAMDNMRDITKSIPTYVKYSMAPLIPGMLGDSQLGQMAKDMKEQKIDEVIYNSGIKVGASGQIDTAFEGKFEFNAIPLDNRHWKLQQEMGAKYMKKNSVIEPSQLIKNVLANIKLDSDYNGRTGQDLVNDFVNTDRSLSDLGLADFEREMGVSFDEALNIVGGTSTAKEYPKLYNTIKEELIGVDAPRQVIEMLEKGVPLDAIPQFRKKIEQTVLSILNKRTVKLQMPGGAFIQQAPIMFEQNGGLQNSDIVWFNEGKTLLPPRKAWENDAGDVIEVSDVTDETDLEGYTLTVKPGQVLLPSKAFSEYSAKFPNKSPQEIGKLLQDAGLLEGVGARIPNQDLASSDYLEVVGILPDYVGDTVVTYPEITAKTGSDYDIDKMFIMLPNFQIGKDGSIVKTAFNTEAMSVGDRYRNFYKADAIKAFGKEAENNLDKALEMTHAKGLIPSPQEFSNKSIYQQNKKEAIQNHKIDLYKQLLLSENSFARLISPIDSGWMKAQAKKVVEARGLSTTTKDLEFFGAKKQFDTKQAFAGGKDGIALAADQLVDHPLTQLAKIGMNIYLGQGKADAKGRTTFSNERGDNGEYITSNISAYLNAFVDIAKDPYIFHLNFNTVTANTGFMLIRAGFDPKWVNAFMSQPALVEYVLAELNRESNTLNPVRHPNGSDKAGIPLTPLEIAISKHPIPKDSGKVRKVSMDSLPSTKELMDELSAPTPGMQQGIAKLFEEYKELGDAFANQVRTFKFDTKGAGQTLVDAVVSENKMLSAQLSEDFTKVENRMAGTMADTYYNNSVSKALELMPQLFLGASEGVRGIVESISQELTGGPITNAKLATKVTNQAYSYLLQEFKPFQAPPAAMIGTKGMGKQVMDMKLKPDSKIKDNPLVRQLKVSDEEVNGRFYSFVRLIAKDKTRKEELSRAWEELIYHEDEAVSRFGKILVKYAAYTSGMNQGSGTFFDIIPASFLEASGFTELIGGSKTEKGLLEKMDGPSSVAYLARFKEQFYRNNWEDSQIVPEVKGDDVKPYAGLSSTDAFHLLGNNERFKSGKNTSTFKPYVTYGNLLYKLSGYTEKNQPVYSRDRKLGFAGEKNHFFEYGAEVDQSAFNKSTAANVSGPRSEPIKRMQVISPMAKELSEDATAKLAMMKQHFPSEVRYDDTLEEFANVETVNGLPVITINNKKMTKDTIIHEYGHVFFAALGGFSNPLLQQGLEQLDGSPIWNEVSTNYPGLTGAALQEEVFITALGREGAKLFDANKSRSKWQQWAHRFWGKVKAVFGIKPSVAKELAAQMLSDQITEAYAQEFDIDGTKYQADERGTALANEADALNEMVERLNEIIEVKAQQASNYISEAELDPKEKARKAKILADILTFSEELAELQGIDAVVGFVNNAVEQTGRINAALHNGVEKGTLTVDTLSRIKSYMATYNVIDDVEKTLRSVEFPDTEEAQEEKAKLFADLDRVRRAKVQIEFTYNRVKVPVIAEAMVDQTFAVREQKVFKLQAEYKKQHPRPNKGKELAEWEEAREKSVRGTLADNAVEYRQEELDQLIKTLTETKYDISSVEAWTMDPRSTGDQIVQMGARLADRADFSTMNTFMDEFRKGMPLYKALNVSNGLAPKDQVKANEKFIKDGLVRPVEDTTGLNKEEVEYLKLLHHLLAKADKSLAPAFKLAVVDNDGRISYKLPSVRKTSMEKFSEVGMIASLKEAWKDATKNQMNDTDEGGNTPTELESTKEGEKSQADLWAAAERPTADAAVTDKFREGFTTVFADEAGNVSKSVPIYFRGKLSKEEQSHDLLGIAMSNLFMAENFKNKIAIAPKMLLLQDAMQTRKVHERKGNMSQFIKSTFSKKLQTAILKKEGTSNSAMSFDNVVETRLFGINIKAGGKVMGMDTNKALATLGGFTGDMFLIANYPAAVGNLIAGHVATTFEAIGGEFFSTKDLKKAIASYTGDFVNIVQDANRMTYEKTSKTNLMLQRFDVTGDFQGLSNSMLKDNKMKEFFDRATLHSLSGIAEHNIQATLMMAILNNIKPLDANGNFLTKDGTTEDRNKALSMWDVYTTKDGNLVLDPRVVTNTRDRSKTEWNEDQEFELSSLIKQINSRLNGNYDPKNRALMQTHATCNLVLQLRKWLPQGVKTRFDGISNVSWSLMSERNLDELFATGYNEATRSLSEGRYITAMNFLGSWFKRAKDEKHTLMSARKEVFAEMGDHERANMAKNLAELVTTGMMAISAAALAGLANAAGDDDDQFLWFAAYMAKRTQNELTFFVNPAEMIKTFNSPAVALKILADSAKMMGMLLTPWNLNEQYASGDHKGEYKAGVQFNKLNAFGRILGQLDKDFEDSYKFANDGVSF